MSALLQITSYFIFFVLFKYLQSKIGFVLIDEYKDGVLLCLAIILFGICLGIYSNKVLNKPLFKSAQRFSRLATIIAILFLIHRTLESLGSVNTLSLCFTSLTTVIVFAILFEEVLLKFLSFVFEELEPSDLRIPFASFMVSVFLSSVFAFVVASL